MAYNLESLVKILEQFLHPDPHHPWILDPNKKPEIESLLEKALLLKELFGNSSPITGDKIESLESRIRDAAHEAEDVIESHMVDQILSAGEGGSFTISPPGLQKVIGEFDSAEEEIKKIMDGSHISDSSSPAESSRSDPNPNPNNILVGIREDSIQLKDRLTRQETKLEIIPIVGMGGIGKTTLARNVYDDPFVVSHFDTRAWITISQDYNVRRILLGLLGCVIGKLTDEMLQEKNDELGVHLYQSLSGRRYLIVLDDVWNIKSWDDTKMYFPDNKNGSRVMVTTREFTVANYAGSNSSHHQMHLLNKAESWNLLHKKVFSEKTCPPELEKIGKKIAKNCRGLPLAIHVIGGLLSQAKRTQEFWVQVARDVSSVVANKDKQFSKILSLSYEHLPNHLKPCFLYMGAFPEDYEIRASKLIRLWVAEGFLEPISDKSLEEAAEMYLKDLVDRNLIFVGQQETNGILKSYGIHDLLRDLCVRKACQEKFTYAKNWQVGNLPEDTLCLRRVSVHSSFHLGAIYGMELMTLSRTFLCIGIPWVLLSRVFFGLRLLRVLDVLGIQFFQFPEEILQLVNLRYLAFTCHSYLPSSISTLWNLQTIIFQQISNFWLFEATYKIFDMPRLRHIKFKKTYPYYNLPIGKSFVPQENLQTLSTVTFHRGFDRILESIPNLKKLGIFGYFEVSPNIDLTCLHKLETLKCSSDLSSESRSFLSCLIFPPSIRKLTLSDCTIPLGYMHKIGTLPNLEVLKLRKSSFESPMWEPTEGEFCRLQFLLLEKLNLINWVADETHFPGLQRLVIRCCSALEEIPSGVGDISTLEIIEVHKSSPSVVASARKIHEEQVELGNYGLQVRIIDSSH
ncbi:hypothetical protein Pfo_020543 [Paulownia fortunei]|nr:hypothetical protein Pfo_020543 [Paulownia fortunei]